MRIKTGLLLLSLTTLFSPGLQAETGKKNEKQTAKPQKVTGKIFADNSFTLFVNGKQVAKDPIKFTPHNTVRVKFRTSYPAVYAIRADDYAHPETGLEYKHTQIGDGGLIIKLSDGTVSNGKWKCKSFSKGPTDRACMKSAPWLNCFVENTPIPKNWAAADFDDSDWNETREYPVAKVKPHGDYKKSDWKGAKFIWGKDLEIDNTVLCRLTVNAPAIKPVAATAKIEKKPVKSTRTKKKTRPDPACKGKDIPFLKFSRHVTTRCDKKYLYIESDGMADHSMMIGITAWNQQVPKPQPYKGNNAWRIPLTPKKAARTTPNPGDGPIAVAINGVPIFDPSKQGGDHDKAHDPNLIGELDVCGGHAGRGDDYHYHTAPKCIISEMKNRSLPVGYALDGYPLYGYLDARGEKPESLDECNGRKDKKGGYRYFSTREFPYVNACFKGLVDLRHRPHTENLRMHGFPIKADIYDYRQLNESHYRLSYRHEGKEQFIDYRKHDDSCYLFHFSDSDSKEIYCAPQQQKKKARPPAPPRPDTAKSRKGHDFDKAAKTLGMKEKKLRAIMGKPPYDYKEIAKKLNADEGFLHDALGIPRPKHLRK